MANNNDLIEFAAGTFRPSPTTTPQDVKFKNRLLVPIQYTLINGDGSLSGTRQKLNPAKDSDKVSRFVGEAWLVTLQTTGALIDVIVVAQGDGVVDMRVDQTNLPTPSIIGAPPATMDVPTFLVGQGKDPKNDSKTLTREAWWFLTTNTVSLPPGASHTWNVKVTEGVEDSSTSLTQFSAQLGAKVSAGWGPISTELEQSLSTSSSVSQTVTLTSSAEKGESCWVSNPPGKGDMTARAWQVRERYAVWKDNGSKEVVQIINDTNNVQSVTTYANGSTTVEPLSLHSI